MNNEDKICNIFANKSIAELQEVSYVTIMVSHQSGISCVQSETSAHSGIAKKRNVSPVRIALVDDDESVCVAVKEMAKSEKWTLDYYLDGRQAVQRIPSTHPDVVLMDVRMPGLSGVECTQKLKCLAPILPIVMLTAYADFDTVVSALMAGAIGYLLKPLSLEQFTRSILQVIHGGVALCEEAQTVLLNCFHRVFMASSRPLCTKRELQVMACLIQNLSDKEIAERLNIAPNTVHVHLVHLFKLLGVHDRSEAIQKFFGHCIGSSCYHCHFPIPEDGSGR